MKEHQEIDEKEEKQLIKIFGEQYKEYVKRVRWRFIPGVILRKKKRTQSLLAYILARASELL